MEGWPAGTPVSPSKGGDVQGKPLFHSPSMELTYEIFKFSLNAISCRLGPAAASWASVFHSPDLSLSVCGVETALVVGAAAATY